MAQSTDIAAWIILFVGLYSLAASIGELRSPGFWQSMLSDFESQPALRFLTGIVVLSLGAAIYLVNPWRPDDWLAIVISILGGLMALEGVLILALGDRFLGFAGALMGRANRAWAIVAASFGIAAIAVALLRL